MPVANQPPPASSTSTRMAFSFPFRRSATSFPAMSEPEKTTFNKIVALIMTGPEERVMQPDLKVDIQEFMFENLTPIVAARIAASVSRAIDLWVPEAKVKNVFSEIKPSTDKTQSTIVLSIEYIEANQSMSIQVPLTVGITP